MLVHRHGHPELDAGREPLHKVPRERMPQWWDAPDTNMCGICGGDGKIEPGDPGWVDVLEADYDDWLSRHTRLAASLPDSSRAERE